MPDARCLMPPSALGRVCAMCTCTHKEVTDTSGSLLRQFDESVLNPRTVPRPTSTTLTFDRLRLGPSAAQCQHVLKRAQQGDANYEGLRADDTPFWPTSGLGMNQNLALAGRVGRS